MSRHSKEQVTDQHEVLLLLDSSTRQQLTHPEHWYCRRAVETSMSLCLYSTHFTFHLTALLLSLHSELFLVAKTGLSLYRTMLSASGLLGLYC